MLRSAWAPKSTDISAAVLGNPLLGAVAQLGDHGDRRVRDRAGRAAVRRPGSFHGALALVVWLNAIMVLIQVGQIVALLLVPPLAAVLAIATIIWALWAFASFVAELHGFQQPAVVLGAVVLTTIVIFFGTAMLLAMLGITPQEVS